MVAFRILFGALASALLASPGAAEPSRPAQCLLEVKGEHYLGGRCEFTPLDSAGSFRIADAQGRNLWAQIQVTKEDEGAAGWSGPAGGPAERRLGAATRAGGCWTLDDATADHYDDTRICAWSLNEGLYLGPSPKLPAAQAIIYYGSRVGMFHDIVSRKNLDTPGAEIAVSASHDGAVMFCREYSRDYSSKCIDERTKSEPKQIVRANCRDRTFHDFNGNKYSFHGKMKKSRQNTSAEYEIRAAGGEILDGSSASGYDVALGIYQALCPRSAPRSSNNR
jgi:hypothetical protein